MKPITIIILGSDPYFQNTPWPNAKDQDEEDQSIEEDEEIVDQEEEISEEELEIEPREDEYNPTPDEEDELSSIELDEEEED
jgi:hypothetical protein